MELLVAVVALNVILLAGVLIIAVDSQLATKETVEMEAVVPAVVAVENVKTVVIAVVETRTLLT